MKRLTLLSLSALALAACSGSPLVAPDSALSSEPLARRSSKDRISIYVTNWDDDGHGSFRWAIEQANADPTIAEIVFTKNVQPVNLESTVTFSGTQALTIDGQDAIIDGTDAGGSALVADGGASLKIKDLTVQNAPGEGIAVEIPLTATGTIKVTLERVTIMDNAGHGVLVNDQVDPETVDGVQPNAAGSAASLEVEVIESHILGNGYSVSDRDGVRVNEGGAGSLSFVSRETTSEDNAADGIELDERGDGNVVIDVSDTHILRNGKFDPLDFDDGFDIDEYDAGSIIGSLVRSEAIDNYEEGLDFNENNAGDLRVDLSEVTANGNDEEGIDYEEDDDFAGGGDLVTKMVDIIANGNRGDGGLKIREKGLGSLVANVSGVQASGNTVSGIAVREDDLGSLSSTIINAETRANAAHGIDFDENSDGDLTATVSNSVSSGNTLFGVRADEAGAGSGTLHLIPVDLTGNTGGTTTGNVVPTITP